MNFYRARCGFRINDVPRPESRRRLQRPPAHPTRQRLDEPASRLLNPKPNQPLVVAPAVTDATVARAAAAPASGSRHARRNGLQGRLASPDSRDRRSRHGVCHIEKVCYIAQLPAGTHNPAGLKIRSRGDRAKYGFPLHRPRKTNGFPSTRHGHFAPERPQPGSTGCAEIIITWRHLCHEAVPFRHQ